MTADPDKSPTSQIYERTGSGDAKDVYDGWAEGYDAENAALGFRLPGLAAAFAARHIAEGAGPLLDAGAGTGQVGSALKVLGYDDISGCDISEQMLAVAARRQAYRELKHQVLGERLDYPSDFFAGVLCIGAFGPGHAPPDTLDELIRVARPGAPIIFNFREDTWKAQGFAAKIEALTDAGLWTPVEDRGPFRPYIIGEPDLLARMFVFRAG